MSLSPSPQPLKNRDQAAFRPLGVVGWAHLISQRRSMFQKLTTRLLSPPLLDVFLTFQRETKFFEDGVQMCKEFHFHRRLSNLATH